MENFEEVYQQYEPMIYSCIRKLRIYKNHDSFIQSGRIGLWKAWLRFNNMKGDFAPFAYRSIYGSILDELKNSAREERIVPTDHQILENLVEQSEKQSYGSEQFYELMHLLTEKEQQLLQLLFLDCYSHDEVARLLNITKAGVKKRRERTIGKLRNFISK
ncbi:sigma-70 family RNA polymerase sigma factor [Paenisporosarcina sp. NPDC076898]|uniref:sigma-70 family RNA polymerase sigma factor n=1 Tax=unclassified Paenisporosarcina TaxID=2642018 RepID=UPI003D071547